MFTITSIKPQRRKDRFNIFIDGKFALGVNTESIMGFDLKVGKHLKEEELKKIGQEAQVKKFTDISLNYLSYRQRSEEEIRRHLAAKIAKTEHVKFSQAIDSPIINKVLTKLRQLKLIDDLEFAKTFINSRKNYSGKSKKLIYSELIKKGVNNNIVENLIETTLSDYDVAIKNVLKKLPRWQHLDVNSKNKKIYEFLTRRGFDYEVVKKVIAKIATKS